MNNKKIIIGTAQFGLNYGISNISGKTGEQEVKEILQYGKKNNLNYLDTSSHYGRAETLLWKLNIANWKVTTKYKTEEILVEVLGLGIDEVNALQIEGAFGEQAES